LFIAPDTIARENAAGRGRNYTLSRRAFPLHHWVDQPQSPLSIRGRPTLQTQGYGSST